VIDAHQAAGDTPVVVPHALDDAAALPTEDASPAVAPVSEPLPKPATWTVRPPEVPWCPPAHREAVLSVLSGATAERFRARCARMDAGISDASVAQGDGRHLHAGDWCVTGAVRRGRRKAHVGEWCEDAYFAHLTPTRGVLVVADGAGSAAWSRLGSAVAVDVIGDALLQAPDLVPEAMNGAVARAVELITQVASAMDVVPKLMRTTVLAAAWEASRHGHRVLSTQVGDGSLVLAHTDGRITRPAAGDSGDWSGEVHCFLPDSETMVRARAATALHDVSDLSAILVVTDGIDDPFYPFVKHASAILGQLVHGATAPLTGLATQAVTPPLVTSAAPDRTLQEWLAFEKRGENDDRTLAVALHRTAALHIAPWVPSASV
jgi:hypothetical protein